MEGLEKERDSSFEKEPKSNKAKLLSKIDVRAYAMILGLIVIWVLFSIMSDGIFLSARNFSNLAIQMAVVSILGTGMVLVIVTGNIDLSVGSLVGLVGTVAAALMTWYGWGTAATIIIVLLLGLCAGLIQGFGVAYMKVPAFIVTLGGMMVFRGALLGIGKGISISPLNPGYQVFGQDHLSQAVGLSLATAAMLLIIVLYISKRKARVKYELKVEPISYTILRIVLISALIFTFVLAMNSYRGVSLPVVIMLSVVLIFSIITQNTLFGRYIYSVGGNMQAAIYSGLNVKRIVLTVFALNGFLAAIAGIIFSARLNAGAPGAGTMMELDAIAAAVIGGTSLMGGKGKVSGAILGALIMASLDNGMSLLNIEAFWQYIVKGLILVLAVWFDVALRGNR